MRFRRSGLVAVLMLAAAQGSAAQVYEFPG